MQKICFKCRKLKDISEFYTHSGMSDGHLNKCKECAKKDSKKRYENNFEYIQNYEKSRNLNENRKKYKKEYREKFKSKNLQKIKSESILNNVIRDGKIKKPNECELCHKKIPQNACRGSLHAHHEDYSKPLDVIWVCPKCHKKIHKNKINSIKNV